MAEESALDLVLMSATAPYVCKIMDYGKYRFDTIKKEKELKKNQKAVALKEVQLSMTIDKHDLEVKAKHAIRFLTDGDKLKIVLKMRGRQQAYAQIALKVVNDFYAKLTEVGVAEKAANIMGRNIIMIVTPKTIKK